MNFKIFLIIYLQLIYTSLANLKLTSYNVTLPTKVKIKYVDMMKFDKLVINDSSPLNLTFKFQAGNGQAEAKFTFYFNGEPMNLKDRQDVEIQTVQDRGHKNFTLMFKKFNEKIAGQYTLKIVAIDGTEINETVNINSPPFLLEFPESKRSTEGNRIEVKCRYTAHPLELDNLEWSEVLKRPQFNYRLSSGQNSSKFKDVIVWDILKKQDAGYYKCEARNQFGNDSVIMQLRVKDRLAPLWPFIGIVIEVIILLAIIIFYERQKLNKMSVENETNPMRQSLLADTKNTDSNEGVRHRNPVD